MFRYDDEGIDLDTASSDNEPNDSYLQYFAKSKPCDRRVSCRTVFRSGFDGRRMLAGKIPIMLAAASKSCLHTQGHYIAAH